MDKLNAKKWTLISAFFYLSCIPFFYYGKKCNNKLWMCFGAVYLVLLGVLFALDEQFKEASWFQSMLVVYWLCGMAHTYYTVDSFLKRKKELEQKEEIEQIPNATNHVEQIKKHFAEKEEQQNVMQPTKSGNVDGGKVIDINSCRESDFTSLPGVSIVMAKRAISYRETHNGFSSKEEFFDAIRLKPHFIVQIQDLVECKPLNYQAISKDNGIGRKLDL